MRIALLAPLRHPITEPFAGGLERHTYLLGKLLQQQGHEVVLYARPESDERFSLRPCSPEGNGLLAQARAYHRALSHIKAGDYDAVHDNSIHFLPPLLAGRLACPMVTTLHTPPYRSHRWAARLGYAKNHRFVSISRHLHDRWASVVGKHNVIHNGIEAQRWPFGASPQPRTTVWYGRLTPEKGAEYAIAAARRAGYRLTLAGPVTDRNYFERKIKPELDESVTYAGHLDQAELGRLVASASVGLVTSVWDEPFGLVYLEMPACGTPVAAFASGAAREVLTATTGTVVPKYDVEALAQVLGSVANKDRQLARRTVLKHFSADRMAEQYQGLYEEARR